MNDNRDMNDKELQIMNVPIEDIIPNRFQPRLNFDENALKELAESIKEHGIIQPLVLRKAEDKFEIVAGERRFKAAKMAGLTSVPAVITTIDDQKSAEVAIVENIQRKNLTAIEEAKSYRALLNKGYLTQEELAKKMGLSQSAVCNKLRLLALPDSVQTALLEGRISERHARGLLQLKSVPEQEEFLRKIIESKLTVRQLDEMLKEYKINLSSNSEPNQTISIPNPQQNQIPNSYFNHLENEQVNMNTSIVDDGIELLDVDVPVVTPVIFDTNQKNLSLANALIDKLIVDLKQNDYDITYDDSDDSNFKTYIIKIKKSD